MSYDPYGFEMSQWDPYMLAEMVGQEYNPYQGYPLKQVSDQVWDVYGPTPDYLIAQQFAQMTPNREKFSVDTFMNAHPMLRGPLAQALTAAKGDTIGAFNEVNTPEMQEQLRKEAGRTEWDQLAASGDLRMLAAMTGEEKDDAAMDFYNRGLEELMAQGAPSSQRLMQQYDYIAERMGGMPYPGAGTTPYDDMLGGMAGGGGAPDPLADLAGADPDTVNITDAGKDNPKGNDRLGFDPKAGQAFASVGGRKYAVQGGPLDRMQLQKVILERRNRQRESAKSERRGGGSGRGIANPLNTGPLGRILGL